MWLIANVERHFCSLVAALYPDILPPDCSPKLQDWIRFRSLSKRLACSWQALATCVPTLIVFGSTDCFVSVHVYPTWDSPSTT